MAYMFNNVTASIEHSLKEDLTFSIKRQHDYHIHKRMHFLNLAIK